eukprot:362252-Amphidinium_carterae.1
MNAAGSGRKPYRHGNRGSANVGNQPLSWWGASLREPEADKLDAAITASSVGRSVSGIQRNVREYREKLVSGVTKFGTQYGFPSAQASRLAKWEQAALQVLSLPNSNHAQRLFSSVC